VHAALARRLADLPRSALAPRARAAWGALGVVPDRATGVGGVHLLAPAHLELAVREPWALLGAIRHAGAIFLGAHSPEPLGDYFAGPNHVLPTMGTARFSSALSVETFTKKSSLIAATPARIQADAAKIARLARRAGLDAHARSAECRTEDPSEES
jgi:histidinol dehydrogenase